MLSTQAVMVLLQNQGEVEKWVGGVNKERAEKALEETVKYLESLKKD